MRRFHVRTLRPAAARSGSSGTAVGASFRVRSRAARCGSSRHPITVTPRGSSPAPTAAACLAEMLFAFRLTSKTRRRFFCRPRRRRRSIAPHEARRPALDARVGERARLLVLPDPTVCFRGASFEQTQSVDVQRGGSIVLMDWMTAGRRASGERWVFDRYASRLTIRYDGRVVFHDALLLSPSEGPLAERMGRFDCVCLIVLVGVALRAHAASACKEHRWHRDPHARADLLTAAAPLGPTARPAA